MNLPDIVLGCSHGSVFTFAGQYSSGQLFFENTLRLCVKKRGWGMGLGITVSAKEINPQFIPNPYPQPNP